jgi:hypothetical protein
MCACPLCGQDAACANKLATAHIPIFLRGVAGDCHGNDYSLHLVWKAVGYAPSAVCLLLWLNSATEIKSERYRSPLGKCGCNSA